MDWASFGLSARPFSPAPDRNNYHPTAGHEAALAELLDALTDGAALTLLTGATGSGKTIVGQVLLERLGGRAAFLPHGRFAAPLELYQSLLFDLGLPYQGLTEAEARLAVTEAALAELGASGPLTVVLDEAQLFAAPLLEELRLLSNLHGGAMQALRFVLLAAPTIGEVLLQPELAGFRQRLTASATLAPLTVEEAADYLVGQLRRAGGEPAELLDEEAVTLLAQATGGVPRLLNQAATRAFRLAAANGQTQVDAEAAVEALAALGLGEVLEPAPELARGLLVPNSSLLADDGLAYSSSAVVVQQPGRPPCLIYAPARSA